MATIEDNFRVEVWDIGETKLVEIISKSPDFPVSMAAWQAALRRRPGMLLIHRNGNHVMERMRTPGEIIADPQVIVDGSVHAGIDASLGDLRDWHRLKARCISCCHRADLDADSLKRRFGADVLFGTVASKLKCAKCRRVPVKLEIFSVARAPTSRRSISVLISRGNDARACALQLVGPRKVTE